MMSDQDVVKKAADELFRLSTSMIARVVPNWHVDHLERADPVDKPVKGIRHSRIRLLPPAPRKPKNFWAKERCFYEMNVGTYSGTSARCEVQFFMAGNQRVCGSGRYNGPVEQILAAAARHRPDVEHISIFQSPYAHLRIRNRVPDPRRMADDMLWIIENTINELESIPNA
jgi:hypothetical protein